MTAIVSSTGPRRPLIGVFGGTFDPPHLGHLIIATEMQSVLGLDRVLFVPTGNPPHKTDQTISAAHHRLTMLTLAIGDVPEFAIDTIEVERTTLSYTAETLALLAEKLGAVDLVFLMGEDSLRDLPRWYQPDRIIALAEIGVAKRPGVESDLDAVLEKIPAARGRIHLVDVPEIAISSSDLRRRLTLDQPIRFQVPAPVEEYIHHHRLYRDQSS